MTHKSLPRQVSWFRRVSLFLSPHCTPLRRMRLRVMFLPSAMGSGSVSGTCLCCLPGPSSNQRRSYSHASLKERLSDVPIIDTHCHVHLSKCPPNACPESLNITPVVAAVTPGDEIPEFGYRAVGIHPWYLDDNADAGGLMRDLRKLLEEDPTLMVGECGLDKPAGKRAASGNGGGTPELQARAFRDQADLALDLRRPLIVHNVKSDEQVTRVVRERSGIPSVVFHSCASSVETVRELARIGGDGGGTVTCFGYSHAVNGRSERSRKAFGAVPLDRVLLESDCSDAGRWEDEVAETIGELADIFKIEPEEVVEISNANWLRAAGDFFKEPTKDVS